LTIGEKFGYFEKPVFGPRGVLMTAVGVGLLMANPTGAYNNYPHDWLQGAGAFGRNYGDFFARNAASAFGRFAFDSSLHIDPRYSRSTAKGLLGRSAHALVFTFISKTDGGHNIPAVGNFAGAVGSGFVGSAYMPNGWNDTTHAGQRALIAFGGYAAHNLFQEFAPEIGRALNRFHVRKPALLPIWWKR
jgi:hypothetical protein